MAEGDVTVSGAFAVDDKTGIDNFITQTLGTVSGGTVSTYPGINAAEVYIICRVDGAP